MYLKIQLWGSQKLGARWGILLPVVYTLDVGEKEAKKGGKKPKQKNAKRSAHNQVSPICIYFKWRMPWATAGTAI